MNTKTCYKQNAKIKEKYWTAATDHLFIQKEESMQTVLGKIP